jgi:ATP-dependent DNA helicase RecQ
LSRVQVERTAAALGELGYRALPYHAGLGDEDRRRHQEAFIRDEADIIVATVAFGMGIDKPNVRFVVHAGMPKSLEAYQQESGRAGRDGLEGECWLFHSAQDYVLWKSLIERGEAEARASALRSLQAMADYCASVVCRRKTLLEYFGEPYETTPCGGCDVCLGELELVEDPLVLSQKILSCVVRLRQAFGGDYAAKVLGGSKDQRVLENRHDQLSTYGLLQDERRRTIRDWIEQLVGQGLLEKFGEYNVLRVTSDGWRVLRGEVTPRLLKPRPAPERKRRRRSPEEAPADSWEGVDRGLFEVLRTLRRERATARGVPAYVVFGDAALRDMARCRPTTVKGFLRVKGVGEKRCADHGEAFVACIRTYCFEQGLPLDQWPSG